MRENPKKYVSVIIPVLNSAKRLERCLQSLEQQSYPRDRFEIIVVDNGSTDETPEVAKRHRVKLLRETRAKNPYMARNIGIMESSGEIIVMLDCHIATPDWMTNGVTDLIEQNADIIGGETIFYFDNGISAASIYDSISNIQMEKSIKERNIAKGCNLFIRREVFCKTGLFPENLRSGIDVLWSARVVVDGFKLGYSPGAIIYYYARGLRALIKKSRRVGRTQPLIWKCRGWSNGKILKKILRGFFPPNPGFIKTKLADTENPEFIAKFKSVFFVAWICEIWANLGRIPTCFGLIFNDIEMPDYSQKLER